MTTHKIKSGETLTSIAKQYNTTVDELAKANGIINKNLIYAGDTLNIPKVTVQGGTTTVESVPYVGTPYKDGEVKVGDGIGSYSEVDRWQKKRPADHKSTHKAELEGLLSDLLGMEFDTDLKKDPAFMLTRDESIKNGLLAMEDMLGKTQSMTGGYGSSYAQGAANQAYAKELSSFTQLIPELYEAAYGRFSKDRDALGDSIRLLNDMDEAEFERYTDLMKLYLTEGEMLFDNYKWRSEEEFDRFLDYASLLQKAAK